MSEQAHGVIHDIGYRRYEGPRLGRGYAVRSLILDTTRGVYGLGRSAKSKVMPMVLLGINCISALIMAVITAVMGGGDLPVDYPSYPITLFLLASIFVAVGAPFAVSRDLRFRSLPLYFSRPLRRGDYALAKFTALALAVFIFFAAPQIILLAGALLAELPVWEQVRGFGQGLLISLIYCLLLTALSLLIASVTPRRGLGVAAVIAAVVISETVTGMLQGFGEFQDRPALLEYGGLVSPSGLADGLSGWLFDARLGPAVTGFSGWVYVLVTVAAIVVGFALLGLRYRRLSTT